MSTRLPFAELSQRPMYLCRTKREHTARSNTSLVVDTIKLLASAEKVRRTPYAGTQPKC